MNFLAHIYLSGNEEDVKIGNFIGDYIKGSAFHIFPEKIKQGILLHRFIDSFTDKNTHTLDAKQLFAPKALALPLRNSWLPMRILVSLFSLYM